MQELKFTALSGTTGVTENLYLYEYGDSMLMVDCGVGFPEPEMFGVDLVIPDFTYVRKNVHKLKAILITHGHEDHLGALPFLFKDVNAPIYSTKLVGGFIEQKFADFKIKNYKLNIFDPEKDTLTISDFRIHPFRISHSVPDSVGFAIDTPVGRFFHVADFKFDWTPVDQKPFDVGKVARLASEGAVSLVSDCLGSTTPGYTQSEKSIEENVDSIVKDVRGRVFFTTISSNISRMQQAINVASRTGRKVVFIGRSIDSKAEISKNLGYLNYPNGIVINPKRAGKLPRNKVLYIISGSYGQPGSALYRVSLGEHDYVKAEPGDVVIFSSDPAPPGSKANVDFVVDKFIESNVEVHYYDMQEDLHVSGHGSQEDIKMLYSLVKPKYLVPVGGTIRHMRAYSKLMVGLGAPSGNILELTSGETLYFGQTGVRRGEKIETRDVLVDGLGVGDVGSVVLRDRFVLSQDGVSIVVLHYDNSNKKLLETPEIISRGFVFSGQRKDLLVEAGNRLMSRIEKKQSIDRNVLKRETIIFLEKFFFERTGRRPMILPVLVEA